MIAGEGKSQLLRQFILHTDYIFSINPDCRAHAKCINERKTVNPGGLQYKSQTAHSLSGQFFHGEEGSRAAGGESGDRKRVLMLASVASMIGQFNLPNIQLLLQMGCEVHVACNFQQGNTCDEACIRRLKETLHEKNVVCHQWDCPRELHAVSQCVRAFFQLRELTAHYRYDMIHCHSPIGGALARIAAHQRGIPVIYTAHGFHFYQGAPLKNWLLYYPVEKLLAYWTDVLITVNQEDYAFARRNLAAKKIYRIPGVGVDTGLYQISSQSSSGLDDREKVRYVFRERYRIPQDAILLLSVGELNKGKNHRVVLKALSRMRSAGGPDKGESCRAGVYYLICGQGELQGWLSCYAKRLGIGAQVRLPGFVQDIAAAYQAADIFVFPSKREGMPVALMEAMAAGLPVVASKIRGNTELIDSNGGILVDADSESGYTAAISRMLSWKEEGKKRMRRMGEYNQEKIRHYDIAAVSKYMKKIYRFAVTGGLDE